AALAMGAGQRAGDAAARAAPGVAGAAATGPGQVGVRAGPESPAAPPADGGRLAVDAVDRAGAGALGMDAAARVAGSPGGAVRNSGAGGRVAAGPAARPPVPVPAIVADLPVLVDRAGLVGLPDPPQQAVGADHPHP